MTTAPTISLAMSIAGGAIGLAMIFRPSWLPGLVKPEPEPEPEPTEDELMARALWDATGGEPANDAARELCRRWGEDQ